MFIRFLAASLLVVCSLAQAYPDRPIKIVVPFPAGSQTDLVARLLANRLESELKAAVVVENRGGGSGVIAASAVAKAPADGYTLMMTTAAIQAMNYSLFNKLPYSESDFTPIAKLASTGLVLMVPADSDMKSVEDVMKKGREPTGKLSGGFGSPGAQIALAKLKYDTKMNVLEVPYNGIPAAITDLIGKQIDFTFVDFGNALAQSKSGRLRSVAVTPREGSRLMADVPAMSKFIPGYSFASWYGVVGPAGLNKEIVMTLSAAIQRIVGEPGMDAKMGNVGVEPSFVGFAEFPEYISKEIKSWETLIRIANIPKQ